MTITIWYGLTSALFGLILFFPIKKIILSLAVNRFERKNKRKINEEELAKLSKRTNIIAAILAVTFAFVYNKVMIIKIFGRV